MNFIEELEPKMLFAGNSPEPPTNLIGVATSDSSIKLTWIDEDKINPDEDRYYIDRTYTNYQGKQITTTKMWHPNTTTFKDMDLKGNTYYTYDIRSFTIEGGIGLPSNIVTVKTYSRKTKPESPSNLMVKKFVGKASFTFVDNSTNEDYFVIQCSKTPKVSKSWSTSKITSNTYTKLYFGESFRIDLPLRSGYYYRVLAYSKAYGYSSPSNLVKE